MLAVVAAAGCALAVCAGPVDRASAATVRTVAKTPKQVRFVLRAAPFKRCRVIVRRGRRGKRVVEVDLGAKGRKAKKVRLRRRGPVRYRVRCRDAHLFVAADGAIASAPLSSLARLRTHLQVEGEVVDLDASSRHIVWTRAYGGEPGVSGVYAANRDGSNVRQLYASPSRFDSDGGTILGNHYYWIEDDAIARVNLRSGAVAPDYIPLPASDLDGLGPASGLAADRRHLYFASCGNNAIGRVRLNGSDLQKYFVPVGDCVQDVAVNRTHIYWPKLALSDETKAIGRSAIDGSGIDPLWYATYGGGELGIYDVAASDRHVFWTSGDTDAGGGRGYVGQLSTSRTGVQPRLMTWATGGIDIAVAP